MVNLEFFRGKRVLLTGHTGFKGSWMSRILINAGAELTGYSRGTKKNPSLFEISGVKNKMKNIVGDVRDIEHLKKVFAETQPEIVIHMAAQPIVRDSYNDPVYTYETNVVGTLNILECVRLADCVKSFLNVTTDKVYKNKEWIWGYRENEPLDGYDPYSNSKSCSELVTHSYVSSFFKNRGVAVSTARAGNVIGGGDFAKDRIIPDCVRAVSKNEAIVVRNPNATRPYQHVLDALFAYLMILQSQYENLLLASCYNIGPDDNDCVTTGELVDLFCKSWGNGASWINRSENNAPHEANFLKLDCTKLKSTFGWRPRWNIKEAVEKVCEWTRVYFDGGDVPAEMDREISLFLGEK
ncbi:MAG: CDP-glucose 4,6-dehydratase [Synergistaceae bacterium]|nr:CDP-glucose 4,6-dehydratase [Synergistaceae bacterium]